MEITIFSNPEVQTVIKLDLSIIISIVALFFSIKVFTFDKNKGKTNQAVLLAKEYSTMLETISAISNIIVLHKNILELVKRPSQKRQKRQFNKEELNSLYTTSELKSLENFFDGTSIKPEIFSLVVKTSPTLDSYIKEYGNMPSNIETSLKFKHITGSLLNDLEHFAMNFTLGLADNDLVYQSLHQSFFYIVDLLYYRIASSNINIEDKYYTNIIALYNSWVDKDTKIKKKLDKNKNKSNKLINPRSKI